MLNKRNIYERTDAVVGVSGGGYTTTAYHVLRWQSGNSTDKQVDHDKVWDLEIQEAFKPESPELHWLRRHTHYVLDSVRVAVQGGLTLAFGIAVNLVLLAVAIGAFAWFLAWVFLASGTLTLPVDKTKGVLAAGSIKLDLGGDWWSLQHLWIVPAIGLGAFLLERAWDRFFTVGHGWRTFSRFDHVFPHRRSRAVCALAGPASADRCTVRLRRHERLPLRGADLRARDRRQDHCEAVINAAEQAAKAAKAAGEEADPVVACGVEGTPDVETRGIPAASIVTIVTSILAVLASVKGASKAQGPASGVRGVFTKVWAKVKDPVVPWLAVTLIVVVCLVQLVRWTAVLSTQPDRLDEWRYALWAAIVLILLKVFSEPNRTSLHHFFRERIAFAFLVRRRFQRIRSMPYREPLRFSRSRPPDDKGPRLVTCAVANASDPTLVPSQRGCTPFVFDDEEIGLTDRLLPEAAGRRGSATYEFAADYGYRDATIPAAVAMSAAAFSPLAGRENVRVGPYRAVLALGNARLGVGCRTRCGSTPRTWPDDRPGSGTRTLPRRGAGSPAGMPRSCGGASERRRIGHERSAPLPHRPSPFGTKARGARSRRSPRRLTNPHGPRSTPHRPSSAERSVAPSGG